MANRLRAVVFDLDGTLANTASLAVGRRVPAQVLTLCPPGAAPTIAFGGGVAGLPGRLIAAGYRVGIITRSPIAYASTVIGLLQLDYQAFRCSAEPEVNLRAAAAQLGVALSEVLYLGDRATDEAAARSCGTQFMRPPWVDGGTPFGLLLRLRLQDGHLANEPHRRRTPDKRYLGSYGGQPPWVSALATLTEYPGYRGRRVFQEAFLESVPIEARRCVMPDDGRVFWPEIVTSAERQRDASLEEAVIAAVGRLFPAVPIDKGVPCPTRACVRYVSDWGDLLRTAKNWGSLHSGSEVKTDMLELPATAIAAALTAMHDGLVVVPVASSPFSAARPGEASRRLAHRAAAMSGREVVEALEKHDAEQRCVLAGRGRRVVVVDDQVTAGTHLTAAVESLRASGYRVEGAVVWSASREGRHDPKDCSMIQWQGSKYGTHPIACRQHGW